MHKKLKLLKIRLYQEERRSLIMYYNAALVLEGGAMRGLYTSGILDVLLKKDIQFKTVIGVSAGSLSGANYVSKQYKRTYNINTQYRDDKEYISMANVLKKKASSTLISYSQITDQLGITLMLKHMNARKLISWS